MVLSRLLRAVEKGEEGGGGGEPPSPFYAANFFPRTIGKHEVFQDISDKK